MFRVYAKLLIFLSISVKSGLKEDAAMSPDDKSKLCDIDPNEANIGLDTFALGFIIFQV